MRLITILMTLGICSCTVQGPAWRIGDIEDERVPALQKQVQEIAQAHNALVKVLEEKELKDMSKAGE